MANRAIIRKGDRTSHGGIVIEGMPGFIVEGAEIALVGHAVSCPRCGGTYSIVQDGPVPTSFFGLPVALADMKTSCGAVLIASQQMSFVETASGGGGAAEADPLSEMSSIVAAFNKDDNQDLEIFFEIVDAQTEAPIENMFYKLLSGDDVLVSDLAFSDGKTQMFSANDYSNLTLIAWRSGSVK